MIKAVAICASRHAGGSTEHLLKRCLGNLKRSGIEGQFVSLLWKKVLPCASCDSCRRLPNRHCAVEGDDFADLFRVILAADIILVGAPVDLGASPSDLKHFLERSLRVSRANGNLLNRKLGAPVAVVAKEASTHSLQRLLAWFPAAGLITPGATSLPVSKGVVRLAVQADRHGEAVADELAENLAWLAGRLG